jgi:putative sigma-54 modulation protein
MEMTVRFPGLAQSESMRSFVERQALFHLGRFGREVDTVEVRVRDVNGPRGGQDMECRVTIRGRRLGVVTITELSHDLYRSAGAAMTRVARALARSLERARSFPSHSQMNS